MGGKQEVNAKAMAVGAIVLFVILVILVWTVG